MFAVHIGCSVDEPVNTVSQVLPSPVNMHFLEALKHDPAVRILRVDDSDPEQWESWKVSNADAPVLRADDGFYILKAKHILPNGTIKDCYLDVSLPERINDYAYFFNGRSLDRRRVHECDGDVIPAVPIDEFGVYELFYSKAFPDVGIEILRQGLRDSPRKACIAQDLGYILRDEKRYQEAAEMFQISIDEGQSSSFIIVELADCYQNSGNIALSAKYRKLLEDTPIQKWELRESSSLTEVNQLTNQGWSLLYRTITTPNRYVLRRPKP